MKGLISRFAVGCGRGGTDRQFFFVNGRPCAPTKVRLFARKTWYSEWRADERGWTGPEGVQRGVPVVQRDAVPVHRGGLHPTDRCVPRYLDLVGVTTDEDRLIIATVQTHATLT